MLEIGYRDHLRAIELDAPLMTAVLGQIARDDADADRIVLTVLQAGKAADLSGYSATGTMIDRLGTTIPLEASVEGNVVTAVLGEGCYAVGGNAAGHVRLVSADGKQRRTLLRFVVDVVGEVGNGNVYDPDAVIGNLDELLARLAAMETATADGLAAAKEARDAGAQAIADASAAGEAAKETAQTAADAATATAGAAAADAYSAAETARETIYTRALAILDDSALAASHSLHAQRDYPLNATLHGYTYQEGEGDPSPDNVRPIHSLAVAQVRAGGKNLIRFIPKTETINGVTITVNKNGTVILSGTPTTYFSNIFELEVPIVIDRNMIIYCHNHGSWISCGIFDESGEKICDVSGLSNTKNSKSLNAYAGSTIKQVSFYTSGSQSYGGDKIEFYINADGSTEYEPSLPIAVINPPLLPDGSALHEGDTVENWVRSGCDVCKAISSADDLTLENFDAAKNVIYSDTTANITVTDGAITTALTYPTTVYYRSTEYTPEKDLRVCRVERNTKTAVLDGSSDEKWVRYEPNEAGEAGHYTMLPGIMGAKAIKCEMFKWKRNYGGGSSFISSAEIDDCAALSSTEAFYVRSNLSQEDFAAMISEGFKVTYELATPEIYMTDPLPLLPPESLESETVTVSASGESEVEYAHDTKHFIIDFVTKALASQS